MQACPGVTMQPREKKLYTSVISQRHLQWGCQITWLPRQGQSGRLPVFLTDIKEEIWWERHPALQRKLEGILDSAASRNKPVGATFSWAWLLGAFWPKDGPSFRGDPVQFPPVDTPRIHFMWWRMPYSVISHHGCEWRVAVPSVQDECP